MYLACSMTRMRFLLMFPMLLCLLQPLAGQTASPEAEQEMSAGKQSFGTHRYDDAVKHFKKANKLRHDSCSECFIWLLRSQMALDNLKEALKEGDRALQTAHTPREQASAAYFRGVVLSRMSQTSEEKLPEAEAAFRASVET